MEAYYTQLCIIGNTNHKYAEVLVRTPANGSYSVVLHQSDKESVNVGVYDRKNDALEAAKRMVG